MEKLSNDLKNKATESYSFLTRNKINQQFAKYDFGLWVDQVLQKLSFSRVLDICCGTGDQLVKFAQRSSIVSMVGVDLSKESLAVCQQRLSHNKAKVDFKQVQMDSVFDDSDLKNKKFDLISCFYGLYYSDDYQNLLLKMLGALSNGGKVLIVGPYGDNNKEVFDFLRTFFSIPKVPYFASCCFVDQEVLPFLNNKAIVTCETFKNFIYYPSAETVLQYWRASTFYKPEFDKQVTQAFRDFFTSNEYFVVEKHVKALIVKNISS